MGAKQEVFVVIAAYNEEVALPSTLESLLATQCSVVVVDDGSSDRTSEFASRLPVHLLRHATNLGQGAALQTGVEYALRKGARIIVHFDADGQHSAGDLADIIRPLESGTADVVLGSRFLRHGDAAEVPWTRRILLRGAVAVNGVLTGMWLSDAHNGFRAMSSRAAALLRLREAGSAHATEILIRIRQARLRYTERPVRIRYSAYSMKKGQSNWAALNILLDSLLGKIFR